jgi:hypothetical protein
MFLGALIDEFVDVAEQFAESGILFGVHASHNTLALMQIQLRNAQRPARIQSAE